jgi:hypothetical protein
VATRFFLICTDEQLSSGTLRYRHLGYVGGALLYFFMGILYVYASLLLVKLYTHYNDDVNPICTYGDLMECIFVRYDPKATVTAICSTTVNQ